MEEKTTKKTSEQPVKSTVKRTLHYYWQVIWKYKWYALGCFLITPVVVFIRAILAPMIFADLIDKATRGLPLDQLIPMVLGELILFGALFIFNKLVLEELRLVWCWKMELMAMRDLADTCFTTVSEQSMQFHSDRFSGSLVSQTNKFVWGFERLLDTIIWDLWLMVIYIIMVVVVMAPQVPWFAVGLLIFCALYAVVSAASFKGISHLNDQEAADEAKQTGQLADSISNIMSVKSYAQEAYERKRYNNFAEKTYKTGTRLMRASVKRDLGFGCVQVGITTLILIFLVYGQAGLGVSVAALVLVANYAQAV